MKHLFPSFLILLGIFSIISASVANEIPVGRIWERVDVRDEEEASAFLIDGETTYVVGTGGMIWSSNDREKWMAMETRVSENLHALAKGAGKVVTVGEGGRILIGSGIGEWVVQPSGVLESLNSVTYGGGYFLVAGDRGVILQSSDGEVWVRKAIGTQANLNDVLWDGAKFHLVGDTSIVATAEAGGEWTIHPQVQLQLPRRDFGKIQFIDGEYVINASVYSSDGETYLQSEDPQPFTASEAAAGAGVNVGLIYGRRIGVSENSRVWRLSTVPVFRDFVALEFSGSEFLAMTSGRRFHTSTDGYRWSGQGLASNGNRISGAVWTGSQYVVTRSLPSPGLEAPGIVTSPDGRSWTTEVTPPDLDLRAVAAGDGNIVAVGNGMAIVHSTNGRDWQKVEVAGAWDLADVSWSGSEFYAVGSLGVILASPDGLVWEMKSPGELQAVTWDGSRYVAVSGPNVLESQNGNDWSPLGVSDPGFSDEMADIHWKDGCFVAVGESGQAVTSTDGVVWTKITLNELTDSFLVGVTPFLPPQLRSKGGFKALPPKANS
ncbi:MAG: hypothetical protein ACJAVK_002546 [Akkermansiaceae bacterium]|jgi:hypothetical protein